MTTLDDCDDAHIPAPAGHAPRVESITDPDGATLAVYEEGNAENAWIRTTDPEVVLR